MENKSALRIPLKDLQKIIALIFDGMEKENGKSGIEIDKDYYFEIPLSEAFLEPSSGFPDATLGQLYDDWEFLERVLSNPEEASPLVLDHLASLLRYIAYKSVG
ncbi:hypothetical protein [Micavibrio aeruginosavorus]|uniref:hypothetical protein n=1 Tax=Micavibrio aeruginosavorus TaxID=349221 RepID=UPI003F4ACEDD